MTNKLRINLLILLIAASQSIAATPKELKGVINHFLNMESTSLEIHQLIDWKFTSDHDSISFRMDIKAGRNFHLTMAAFGMDIYVSESEMMTLNHVREQILYENATPDALIKQIFVGGDLKDARFKGEKDLGSGLKQLDFRFIGDFSDWQTLSVVLDAQEDLKKLTLVDYDGNDYIITLKYLVDFDNFTMPDIKQEFIHYQIADMRK